MEINPELHKKDRITNTQRFEALFQQESNQTIMDRAEEYLQNLGEKLNKLRHAVPNGNKSTKTESNHPLSVQTKDLNISLEKRHTSGCLNKQSMKDLFASLKEIEQELDKKYSGVNSEAVGNSTSQKSSEHPKTSGKP